MCGLIGAFRADNANLTKLDHFMWQGLYMSALRGMGGTGVGLVHREYGLDLAKSHVSSPNFLCSEEWDWIDRHLTTARAALGHTRSATQGGVKTKNAHPFLMRDEEKGTGIMMIHNGHIKNWAQLSPHTYSHEVDSAHVCHSLFTRGAIPTLEMIEGAYTLVWYDLKEKTLNMARNQERELFYTTDKDKTCLWFMSELDMLSSVLKRNGIKHERNFHELPQFTLCTYDLTKKFLEPVLTEYKEKKPVPAYPNGRSGPTRNGNDGYKNFTKDWPAIGDSLFCNIRDDDDTALVLFKPIGDGENQVSQAFAYGYVYGTRSMDYGSIVRVNGIQYDDWHDRIRWIKNCLPCKITNVVRGVANKNGAGVHTEYTCVMDMDEVEIEIQRTASSIAARKQYLKSQKEREAVSDALAAGRALPIPSTPPASPRILGPDGKGIGESPNVGPGVGGGSGQLPTVLNEDGYVSYPQKVPGPRGTKIDYTDWELIALEGCYLCEGVILTQDLGHVDWWPYPNNPEDRKPEDIEYKMVCPTCINNPKRIEEMVG